MKWITKDEVKDAAKAGKMEALKMLLKHHEQGRDCTRGELVDGWDDDKFDLGGGLCACCAFSRETKAGEADQCSICPLAGNKPEQGTNANCCNGTWTAADKALGRYMSDPSPANFLSFQQAEGKVCEYIEGVIEKIKAEDDKPELRHGDIDKHGHIFVKLESWLGCDDLDYKQVVLTPTGLLSNIDGNDMVGRGIIGNIFDDIASRDKKSKVELGNFDMSCDDHCGGEISVSWNDQDGKGFHINVRKGGEDAFLTVAAKDFHEKLGRMIATKEQES
jgi:hypothetical protein